MDPVLDNEWLGSKNDAVDEAQNVGNVVRSWQWRERGIDPLNSPPNKTVLENVAEDILVQKPLKIRCCDLPGYPRSTYLMVFSPDGTKVASTHGNHNVYVSELASGKHVRILKGHPRTPWCIAFHPSHPQLIGSGCLGGQVRVWDISSGGSEVWNVRNETVIASIAFHPREQLLVIGTYNELYFWDWSQPAPFTKVSTNNINEKVRYVAFDSLGYKLITGISLRATVAGMSSSVLQQNSTLNPANNQSNVRRDDTDNSPGNNRPQDNSGSTQDIIVNSYQNLVQRYDSLVRNYQRLFMVRHRLTVTPPPPSTMDRGTDPMETDPSPEANSFTRTAQTSQTSQSSTTHTTNEEENPPSSSSNNTQENTENDDGEGSSRLLNLDALSFESGPSRERNLDRHVHSLFGSRPSAFHPLNDNPGRSFRTVDQNERASRLLPNPFSSTSGSHRPSIISFTSSPSTQTTDNVPNTSRTSIFPAYRPDSPSILDLSPRRWSGSRRIFVSVPNENSSTLTDNVSPTNNPPVQETPVASTANSTQRPSTSYSSSQTQSSTSAPVDAQTINESLDLIRDILRDSGTRLLNLITNMSLSTLASVEEELPRRTRTTRTQADNNNEGESPRETPPRARIFSSHLRPGFLSTSSESDSDQSPEVNIFRTRNSTFREDDTIETERPLVEPSTSTAPERPLNPTDRLVFDLDDSRTQNANSETGGINVSANSSRFRVRTQSNTPSEGPSTSNTEGPNAQETPSQNNTSEFNPNRPSTSRDNFWANGCVVPPDEAFRKVRAGVSALQKHTMQLTNMWLRGNRTTMPELRNMWENLRRRILMLHRETGRQDLPSYYTRSLLERCMMLTEMTDNVTRGSSRNARPASNSNQGNSESVRNSEPVRDEPSTSETTTVPAEPEQSTSRENTNDNRQPQTSRTSQTRPNIRSSPSLRRRLQSSYRWRPEDELRRRSRNSAANRLSNRYSNRPRRDFARAIEISATRHEIRMRAMQVLSVMFNMMMMCLEERGLSQLIINMLRTLKKALALTCLMLMTNRNNGRASNNASPQRVDSLNVIRLENVDHTGPVNVDGPDESPHHSIASETEEDRLQSNANKRMKRETSPTPQPTPVDNSARENTNQPAPIISQSSAIQAWSNRLAVQIAAANRNNSATARNRRELYIESRRLKALHKTNPNAHPMIKKKALPPASTYRIPTLRLLPSRRIPRTLAASRNSQSTEPVAGPSGILSGNDGESSGPSRLPPDVMNEFEHRINLIRMAHMQAVRLRNAARSRFRRLQTIRLYTPSSVREMFTLQPDNENPHENRSPLQSNSDTNRRSFTSYDYRPHILTRERIFSRGSANRPSQESGEFHAVITNASVPLMQVGDLSINNPDAQGNQNQRLPRIHEYLQPIILAQNAMVVDDEGNAEGGGGSGGAGGRAPGGGGPGGGGGLGGVRRMTGMAGLLDAGIISEALPASSHRVQAWDFTTGNTPDIADSSKNVVVQRCRIHNDASIDISKDGRLLVALLPVPRIRNTNHWLGVYSLEWSRLGQCLHTAVLEQSAVSVALSPTARHLAVGLGSRRFTSAPHARTNVFALLYRLDPLESSSRTGLSPIKELEQTWEHGFTSLNCLRWAPQPGQGLVYANNTGQLIIMS
ncbi:activating molecule in BECN1-regulated autophagy protein 1B-like [Vanessa atalanta]|uniref:activating molecule in BECN1-regulated autophagy protein 1B-like n=1 Tax=Vanessa atalanta TaxID=42275 RepID=UPI001FCDA96D|nr:activating molecule in BECN1-regulated autophagy protein 1B-like [Vanessa atalanta]